MKFFETSKQYSLKKSIYINLRWIGIIGQLISVYLVYFYFDFDFNFIFANLFISIGVIGNLYLIFVYKKTQLTDRSAFIHLLIDIIQLSGLIYLTGGVKNPFIIFLIIPSVFASSNLSFRTNSFLVLLTTLSILGLTFISKDLPEPLNDHFHVSNYYIYAIPLALIIALLFLNYFAIIFGAESKLRKDALNKMEEIMAKEHEMLSLGGQAAAAAHSLGTPLSTILLTTKEIKKEFGNNHKINKDLDLLVSQSNRCSQILKSLTLNPNINDEGDYLEKRPQPFYSIPIPEKSQDESFWKNVENVCSEEKIKVLGYKEIENEAITLYIIGRIKID